MFFRNGSVVKFTLFFVSTATPSVRALVTSLTKGPVSSAGTVTLPPGLGIAVNTVEVLKIAGVPQDLFLPNVPGICVRACVRAFMLYALNFDKYVFVENV